MFGEPAGPEAGRCLARHDGGHLGINALVRGGPARRTPQVRAGEPSEIRAFVLSRAKCTALSLHWRPLGRGAFKQATAMHRARRAFRTTLPTKAEGTLEYYLEAVLEDGSKAFWPAGAPERRHTVIAW